MVNHLDGEPFALSFSGQGYAWLPNLQAEEVLEPLADDLAAAQVGVLSPGKG
ncbi:hypothetical protein QP414_09715 [Corynebacterium simulans]|uniref:Fatty-acid synthase domain protein n=1 Tax=Corynebacterium simulans TaxID=146827 RepID=A0ABR5V7G8_9CORY|nr:MULTISPECIES: hypothetical protein [Corynebacterium]MDU3176110.1 hypothetical protein [Corynebacterium striatum]AMO92227.1 fatty-acid synthase domain protein [Corynebacterium simulans]KXU17446.1 fatty-acid synthase domain protein [Corynebacterium simulans]MCG7248670.1 hypothetical protein [Corynebacterium simulans]MDK7139578.1 hypothetical protein [Corynebacterium simulans]